MSYGEHSHWSNTGRVGDLMSEVGFILDFTFILYLHSFNEFIIHITAKLLTFIQYTIFESLRH